MNYHHHDHDTSLYHTIIIAKGLSSIDPSMTRCFQFWRHFKSLFQDSQTLHQSFKRLKWGELGSILFTLSQIKLLNSDSDWQVITEVFKDRMNREYDQEKVIKGITSLSLANVSGGQEGDFWFEVFETIEKRIKPEQLDVYIKMNLMWSMAKNYSML